MKVKVREKRPICSMTNGEHNKRLSVLSRVFVRYSSRYHLRPAAGQLCPSCSQNSDLKLRGYPSPQRSFAPGLESGCRSTLTSKRLATNQQPSTLPDLNCAGGDWM